MEIQNLKPQSETENPQQQSGRIIADSQNICLIPSENPEAIISALALFYTLKELNKNVNLIIEDVPDNLKFLAPSLDFVSYPKNFVISIPNKIAKISQIHYEKNDEALKINLTLENGNLKKDNISFYFSETKPDLVITLGIKDYSGELTNRLNSFGFLLDSPILNIDSSPQLSFNAQDNKKFGKINLLKDLSLTEIVFGLIKDIYPVKSAEGGVPPTAGQFNGVNNNPIKKELAECLLTGIVIYTENFRKNITADIFQTSAELIKEGADLKKVTNNLKI